MPSITINSVTFAQTPLNPMVMNFYYKTGAGSNILFPGCPVTVPVNGILPVPLTVNGLSYNTLYTVTAVADCGGVQFEKEITTPSCECEAPAVKASGGDWCELVEFGTVHITPGNNCLAISKNDAYSSLFTRIYNVGFHNETIAQTTASIPGDVAAQLTHHTYWKNNYSPSVVNLNGPMNRAGVWVDTDCNGTKDAMVAGVKVTIGYAYYNAGGPRLIYVGCGADDWFELKVNGTTRAICTNLTHPNNFKIWHVFPVLLQSGWNDINIIATSSANVQDCVAMNVYDVQSPVSLFTATDDVSSNLVFTSSSKLGQNIDVAYCDPGFGLVQGIKGSYQCRKTTITNCGAVT